MIKSENITTKPISISNRISITNLIVESNFTENDETGEIEYTPFFAEISKVTSFATYVLAGVEFDEDEDIYESVMGDKVLKNLFIDWTKTDEYNYIRTYVADMVEFKKQQLIHNKKSSLDNLINAITDVVKKMDESLNMNDVSALLPKLAKLGENFNQEEVVNQIINSISSKEKYPTTLPLAGGK